MSNILRNELYIRITFVEWMLYGISFYNNIFGKVLVFNFWNLFLRTLKDFYSYRLIEYVIGYIGRGGSLHLHILCEIIRGFFWDFLLNGCCMGFIKNIFGKVLVFIFGICF